MDRRPAAAGTRRRRTGRPSRRPSPRRLSPREGHLPGTVKDGASIRPDWLPAHQTIDGVHVTEVRNVLRGRGMLTEVFRAEWAPEAPAVDQVFQVVLGADEVSAWHMHRSTIDRLFVNQGAVRIVLYDARRRSPTHGRVNEFRFGRQRPALVVIPPGVWHGIQNLHVAESCVLNLVDRAYAYDDPDHWRLPADTSRIPFRFTRDAGPV